MSFSQKPRKRVSIDFTDTETLTEQHHKDECDIHNILKKSQKTGILEHVSQYSGEYGNMPTGNEFHEHMNIIAKAETMFETVPSKIRQQFDNDPAKFLDFMQDKNNKSKIDEMGLDSRHLPEPPKPKTEVKNSGEESLPSS